MIPARLHLKFSVVKSAVLFVVLVFLTISTITCAVHDSISEPPKEQRYLETHGSYTEDTIGPWMHSYICGLRRVYHMVARHILAPIVLQEVIPFMYEVPFFPVSLGNDFHAFSGGLQLWGCTAWRLQYLCYLYAYVCLGTVPTIENGDISQISKLDRFHKEWLSEDAQKMAQFNSLHDAFVRQRMPRVLPMELVHGLTMPPGLHGPAQPAGMITLKDYGYLAVDDVPFALVAEAGQDKDAIDITLGSISGEWPLSKVLVISLETAGWKLKRATQSFSVTNSALGKQSDYRLCCAIVLEPFSKQQMIAVAREEENSSLLLVPVQDGESEDYELRILGARERFSTFDYPIVNLFYYRYDPASSINTALEGMQQVIQPSWEKKKGNTIMTEHVIGHDQLRFLTKRSLIRRIHAG